MIFYYIVFELVPRIKRRFKRIKSRLTSCTFRMERNIQLIRQDILQIKQDLDRIKSSLKKAEVEKRNSLGSTMSKRKVPNVIPDVAGEVGTVNGSVSGTNASSSGEKVFRDKIVESRVKGFHRGREGRGGRVGRR